MKRTWDLHIWAQLQVLEFPPKVAATVGFCDLM